MADYQWQQELETERFRQTQEALVRVLNGTATAEDAELLSRETGVPLPDTRPQDHLKG